MRELVERLVSNFNTRDPYVIASGLGIVVLEEPLGSINGYYNEVLDVRFIHVNCDLPDYQKRFVVAHELGHALLHPDFNFYFLKTHTYFNIGKLENEADKFAVLLIVESSDDFETVNELAVFYGLSDKLKHYINEGVFTYGIG